MTSGELAIEQRDAPRRCFRHRAVDHDLDQLARAFAVARHLLGEIGEHGEEAPCESREPRIGGAADLGAPFAAAAPVAKASSVSEVEVSPSMVTALKVSATPSCSSVQRRRRDRRVGEDEGQHGRHVGRDHAGALGDAADGDVACRSVTVAAAPSGKVSVVMIAFAAASHPPGAASATSLSHDAFELRGIERLADDAGRGEKTSSVLHRAAAAISAVSFVACAAGFAGKGVGVAGIHHQRADALAALQLRPAPFDRRRRTFRAGEDAGDRCCLRRTTRA